MFLEDGVEVGNVLRGNLAVFVKSSQHKNLYPKRILHTNKHFYNGIIDSEKVIQNFQNYPEDRYFTTFPSYISGYFHQIRKLQEKEILVKKSRTEKAIKLPIF